MQDSSEVVTVIIPMALESGEDDPNNQKIITSKRLKKRRINELGVFRSS